MRRRTRSLHQKHGSNSDCDPHLVTQLPPPHARALAAAQASACRHPAAGKTPVAIGGMHAAGHSIRAASVYKHGVRITHGSTNTRHSMGTAPWVPLYYTTRGPGVSCPPCAPAPSPFRPYRNNTLFFSSAARVTRSTPSRASLSQRPHGRPRLCAGQGVAETPACMHACMR